MPSPTPSGAPSGSRRAVTVRVPATSANLGPGFDALGVALDWTARITLSPPTEGAPTGSTDPIAAAIEGMATAAAAALFEACGEPVPVFRALYEGDMPVGRGLGMSAAARAAGLVAANAMLGGRLSDEEIVPLAVHLEGHGDNIIPALFGGLQVVVHGAGHSAVHVPIAPPEDLRLALLIPEFSMPTEESRKRLPVSLTRHDAVANIGRAALVVAALTQRRYDALDVAVEDTLHQPARSQLFPAMYPIFEAAREAGAYGAYLSGGGSTVAAFVSPDLADAVAAAMLRRCGEHGVGAVTRVVAMSGTGAQVVDQ
ncbi:MAG: homoserine kinase [Dehalococcoidia bacterium]